MKKEKTVQKSTTQIPEDKLAEAYFDSMNIAFEKLRKVLRSSKYTQRQIATRINKDPAMVSRLLTGQENLTLRTLSNLAQALDHTLNIEYEPVFKVKMEFDTLFETRHPVSITSTQSNELGIVNSGGIQSAPDTGSGQKFDPIFTTEYLH